MSFSNQTIDFEALLYALAQQTEPLPTDLQHSLTEIGRSLHEDRPDSARQLRALIQQYLPLENEYKNALAQSDARYASQQRAKILGARLSPTSRLDDLLINRVFATNDWVTTSKKVVFNQTVPKQRSQFLERGDRVVTLASGGAFLGVLIAQLPGAIIGGLLIGIYAWFSFPAARIDGNS
jgi:hypothetical protein